MIVCWEARRKTPYDRLYEDGELRDKSFETKQRADFQSKHLLSLIKKAVKKAPKGA